MVLPESHLVGTVRSEFQQRIAESLGGRQPARVKDPAAQEAAVAVLVGTDPDAVLIIRRAERSGDPWSGHMGLPGGRRDKEDEHLLATAIRETQEEVGLVLTPANLLGSLDDVAPKTRTRPLIFARPYVFEIQGNPLFKPNHEVSSAYWVPVSRITAPDRYRPTSIQLGEELREFPAYHLEGGIVWGMTERVLTSLLDIARP